MLVGLCDRLCGLRGGKSIGDPDRIAGWANWGIRCVCSFNLADASIISAICWLLDICMSNVGSDTWDVAENDDRVDDVNDGVSSPCVRALWAILEVRLDMAPFRPLLPSDDFIMRLSPLSDFDPCIPVGGNFSFRDGNPSETVFRSSARKSSNESMIIAEITQTKSMGDKINLKLIFQCSSSNTKE